MALLPPSLGKRLHDMLAASAPTFSLQPIPLFPPRPTACAPTRPPARLATCLQALSLLSWACAVVRERPHPALMQAMVDRLISLMKKQVGGVGA